MRISDILQARDLCYACDITKQGGKIVDMVEDFHEMIYTNKKKQEFNYWVDRPSNFLEKLDSEEIKRVVDDDDDDNFVKKNKVDRLTKLEKTHSYFTNGSIGVGLLKIFLGNKFP